MIEHTTPQRPWFKQFWPWFVVLIPATGVLAALATLTIAMQAAPTLTHDDIGRFAREQSTVNAKKTEQK